MALYAFAGSLTQPAPHFAAANGEGISVFRFDDEAGTLTAVGAPLRVEDASWIAAGKGGSLYATTETPDHRQSALAALNFDAVSETLRLLNVEPLGGLEACHLSLDAVGETVFAASYGGHREDGPDFGVAVMPVRADGSVAPASFLKRHEGKGPNAARQEAPHAHCVVPSPDGRFLFVADLGIDRLVAYELPGMARRPDLDAELLPGLGPRHFLFDGAGRHLYLVSELIPTVVSFRYDAATGRLEQLASLPIEPPAGGKDQPAGIALSGDGRHLYVSLRLSDDILLLAIDEATGMPHAVSRTPSGGVTPRDLKLSPSGRHLIVANQDSDRLTIFRRDAQSGALTHRNDTEVGTPMTVALAEFA